MNHFHHFTSENLKEIVNPRANETKLGEKIKTGFEGEKYVLLGIPESFGVKGNLGVGGTESLWPDFLKAFLNIQSTDKFRGDEISIVGHFDFKGLLEGQKLPVDNYRKAVEIIDAEVSSLIKEIVLKGKIPIVVGGGHNNCFPILKGINEGLTSTGTLSTVGINAINLDAHSDFRQMEGRHSGNGFRYAYEAGYLKKYAIVGLHENYNSQTLINELTENQNVHFSLFEDIFLREVQSYPQALEQAISFTQNEITGIELDLDCIEGVLSSAATPSGISSIQARKYLFQTAKKCKVGYVHICEGATQLENGQKKPGAAKLVSYLVSDFIKANLTV
ncbi:formimidoylglutamase [Litoribacter ruber]|uniref:formimidoylglutamase n=1 Tax=Litoribacter ruber TaxID=702568 RepID=UPI001BD9C6E6|nr:formimidoylglutamase [Litoribacter ruber]MBT0812459.1 formimidoylglutamase [Litoribacter ruber]